MPAAAEETQTRYSETIACAANDLSTLNGSGAANQRGVGMVATDPSSIKRRIVRCRERTAPEILALAIKFEEMIHAGVATDYADLARLGGAMVYARFA